MIESQPRDGGTCHVLIQGNRAVLIDPPLAELEGIKSGLDARGLLLRYVLHTASEAEHSPLANGSYTHLLASLGAKLDLDLGLEEATGDDETTWDLGFSIRPLDRQGDLLYMECGVQDIALDPSSNQVLELDACGDDCPERVGALFLPFGGQSIQAIPLPGAQVAWQVGDRVFWSGDLEELPPALDKLSPSTLLYTSAPGPWITSIQQLRWSKASR